MQADVVRERLTRALREGAELRLALIPSCTNALLQAVELIHRCFQRGGKILLFGNGGSAADAQHIAAEFVGRFARDRAPLPALALTTDTSALTAIGNDYGFEHVFARQVRALGRSGDVAVAISTSGRSPNVLAGVEASCERGLSTIGFTGGDGGQLAALVNVPLVVPSTNTARIQECHIAIGHILCDIVESLLFAEGSDDEMSSETTGLHPLSQDSKVVDWDTLLSLRQRWRAQGRTVVWTNGCFDLLHVGHVCGLEAARDLGDVLVVGVNSDASVRSLKGPGRPIIAAAERMRILAALACVDYVVGFDEATPEVVLSRLQPDVHCKGGDYMPPHGKPVPEARVVESYGGRVAFLPLFASPSTSSLIQRSRAQDGEVHDNAS
jgi:phosphoheptose isomerase